MPGSEAHIETLAPWVSLGVHRTAQMADLHEVFGAAFEAVAKAAADAGAKPAGPAYAEYFGEPTDTVDVEIGFGIDHLVDVAGMVATDRPATQAVVATHVGPYDKLSETYAELMPWLETRHLALTDSMFEFYDTGPEVAPEAAVTRVVFPLA